MTGTGSVDLRSWGTRLGEGGRPGADLEGELPPPSTTSNLE